MAKYKKIDRILIKYCIEKSSFVKIKKTCLQKMSDLKNHVGKNKNVK